MSLLVAGQIAGIAFACGLNLYATVAVLGILSRVDLLQGLPPGLQGLEGTIVIASALVLYVIEAVVDKIHHADSLWDAVHTLIRPPAAALLAVGALWAQPTQTVIVGAALALGTALAAHGSKAGLRLALNATMHTRAQTWISVAEDVLAIAFAVCALQFPLPTLAATAAAVIASILFGPRLWRAFRLGIRCLAAWLRSIFRPSGWRMANELPAYVRRALGDPPLGTAPPQGTRAAVLHAPDVPPFRNGWLVLTPEGPVFVYRTALGTRVASLPTPAAVRTEPGVWANLLRVDAANDSNYSLLLLKDGPEPELASQNLSHAIP